MYAKTVAAEKHTIRCFKSDLNSLSQREWGKKEGNLPQSSKYLSLISLPIF